MRKILSCHNYYLYRGGEDQSFEDEVELLRSRGHEVVTWTQNSQTIQSSVQVARGLIWSQKSYSAIREIIDREKPELVHFTNTFPLISLAGPAAAKDAGLPVVASIRNYRPVCAGAYFLRDGKVCEKCLTGNLGTLPAIYHRCYRDSYLSSIALAGTIAYQKWTRAWERSIDVFYSPSEFARLKLIEGGFPADRFMAKPNFVAKNPDVGDGTGNYLLFAGRLSPEKGLSTILDAWNQESLLPNLHIVGEGPELPLAEEAAKRDPRIQVFGKLPHAQLLVKMGEATAIMITSLWYETFGRTIVESFSKGTPVIASNLGAMAELVRDGITGVKFEAGDARSLIDAVQRLTKQHTDLASIRSNCRREFEERYTPEANYKQLIAIYERAIEVAAESSRSNKN
jgi:glycosyltransferase involved in cell wall biosynthesis